MNKRSLYGLTLPKLTAWLAEQGIKKSRALAVWDELYRRRRSIEEFEGLAADCRLLLAEHFSWEMPRQRLCQEAADGTVKFLLSLEDGHLIETVLMRHKFGAAVCVTTQVGCNMGCSFCASGLLQKKRDVTAGEMVQQLLLVQQYLDAAGQGETVSHVVVMGIGEPFDNFANLQDFLEIIKEHKGLAIAARRITVSTSGLANKIYDFTDANLQVNLAISLHAPTNELRGQLMKVNAAFDLDALMAAVDYYLARANRRVTFEYILLEGINDSLAQARELAELIGERHRRITVNLIPYNTVDEHSRFRRSSREVRRAFYDALKKQGIQCSIRLEHGADIDAACGQLRSKAGAKAPF